MAIDIPDDKDGAYDFGLGAGFYVNATQAPWNNNYNMYDYISKELPNIISSNFDADLSRHGIFGHSMGGHGALTIGLKNPDIYRSISAFAPICNPVNCPWGKKAFGNYLGDDQSSWNAYDATEIVASGDYKSKQNIIRIDQGLDDEFYERELSTDKFEQVCRDNELVKLIYTVTLGMGMVITLFLLLSKITLGIMQNFYVIEVLCEFILKFDFINVIAQFFFAS